MTRSEGAAAKPAAPAGLGRRLAAEARGYVEALAIAFLVVTFGFTTVGVIGGSMRPTLNGGDGGGTVRALLSGDRVFLPKIDTWLRRAGILGPYDRGEIVVLREPANGPTAQATGRRKFVIKRVIARGGDTLRVEGGRVFVDGVELADDFVTAGGEIRPAPVDFPLITARDGRVEGLHVHLGRTAAGTTAPSLPRAGGVTPPAVPPGDPRVQLAYGAVLDGLAPLPDDAPEGVPFVHEFVIPQDTYWVMGDNRGVGGSEDSRLFGPVPALSVAGRATAVIWPPRRDGGPNWRRLAPPPAFEAIPAP